ncbi:hypothetical protein A605_10010 [Corynebacterium halotolerans YIM 70093 = DSM 44683]|uniref:Secreted protein n=2 Tax=Corynebacterium halotolerans TaxID=225326 RepID=M1MZA0_9CORY|nr:hypothetical protein A605_10010 [Corynebacterium halotolerans YIM 70093 = DSM 44683]
MITGAGLALAVSFAGTTVAHAQSSLSSGSSALVDSDARPEQQTAEQRLLETATGAYAARGYTLDEEAEEQAEAVVAAAVDGEDPLESYPRQEYDPESRTQTTLVRIPRDYMEPMIRHAEDTYLQAVILGTSYEADTRLGLAVGSDAEYYYYAEVRMPLA